MNAVRLANLTAMSVREFADEVKVTIDNLIEGRDVESNEHRLLQALTLQEKFATRHVNRCIGDRRQRWLSTYLTHRSENGVKTAQL